MKQPVIEFDTITQGQLEKYFKVFRELGGKDESLGLIEYAGVMVRAAVNVGWLELDVDNAKPHDVLELQRSIQEYVKTVMEYDAKN